MSFLCLNNGFLTAQKVTISGTVHDQQGVPLIGATVMVVGGMTGTVTDLEGAFSLMVPSEKIDKEYIQVSFLGKETQRFLIADKVCYVILEDQSGELSEIIVTGYKQTTVREATGSVSRINKTAFENKAAPNVDELMQGMVAGVSVQQTSGRPGATSEIRIRGTNTISGSAEPLWVVDGVPLLKDIPKVSTLAIESGDMSDIMLNGISGINPNDIESVSVLKDASAAAIYGSRASGGVIVIQTKRGQAGKMKLNYSNSFTVQLKPQRDANLMNSSEKLDWEQNLWDEFSAKKEALNLPHAVIGVVGAVRSGLGEFSGLQTDEQNAFITSQKNINTDWYDVLFQNSLSQSHYLSMSGGLSSGESEYNYYVSMGYSGNKGLVKNTDFSRYNVSTKLDLKPNKIVKIGLSFDLSSQESNSYSMNVDPFTYAYFANPYERPYDDQGNYEADKTYFALPQYHSAAALPLPVNGFNIMREMDNTSAVSTNYSNTLTSDILINITEKLKFTGIASYSFTNNKSDNINGKDTYAAFSDRLFFDAYSRTRTYGSITQTSANNRSYTARGQFSYNTDLNTKSNISVLAGSEIRSQDANSIFLKRYGYDAVTRNSSIPVPPSDYFVDYNTLQSYASLVDNLFGESKIQDAFASFYASADYRLLNKYILSSTLRTDGSNHFGSNQQFNPTWSLGAAWHIDQEAFMYQLKDVINGATLRLATGYTGNTNKTVYPQVIMDYLSDFRKTDYDTYRKGEIRSAPNPNLTWEKTRDIKAALSLSFFRSRIRLQTELYHRISSGIVTNVQVSSTTGFTSQGYNSSKITNDGFELTLNAGLIKRDNLKWNASFNIANNINTLIEYNSPSGYITSGKYVDYPLNSLFSGKNAHIDATTGYYVFDLRSDAVITKPSDNSLNDNYLFYIGTSTPPISGGFSTSVVYKNLALSINGNFTFGQRFAEMINPPSGVSSLQMSTNNEVQSIYNDLYTNHFNVTKDRINRWTTENPITDGYPIIIDDIYGDAQHANLTTPISGSVTNSIYQQDVSYLRIRSINLSYSLDSETVSSWGISSLAFHLSLNNFFTFTNYDGIDPETPGATYPITRSITSGLNLSF